MSEVVISGVVAVVAVMVTFVLWRVTYGSRASVAAPVMVLWDRARLPFAVVPIVAQEPHAQADDYSGLQREAAALATRVNVALSWAARFWNANLSMEAFVPHDAALGLRTVVPMRWVDKPLNKVAHARLYYAQDGTIIRAAIGIDAMQLTGLSQELCNRVLAHEFGHLLGLPHSGSKESIMYRVLRGGDYYPVVLAEDRALLRAAYSKAVPLSDF